jgi:hypothetical protein
MSHTIEPDETTYFVFYGTEVTHVGVALAGYQTTSGQPNRVLDTDPASWLEQTTDIPMDLPELPEAGASVPIGIYVSGSTRLICHTEHTRTGNPPADEPQHFTVE